MTPRRRQGPNGPRHQELRRARIRAALCRSSAADTSPAATSAACSRATLAAADASAAAHGNGPLDVRRKPAAAGEAIKQESPFGLELAILEHCCSQHLVPVASRAAFAAAKEHCQRPCRNKQHTIARSLLNLKDSAGLDLILHWPCSLWTFRTAAGAEEDCVWPPSPSVQISKFKLPLARHTRCVNCIYAYGTHMVK